MGSATETATGNEADFTEVRTVCGRAADRGSGLLVGTMLITLLVWEGMEEGTRYESKGKESRPMKLQPKENLEPEHLRLTFPGELARDLRLFIQYQAEHGVAWEPKELVAEIIRA